MAISAECSGLVDVMMYLWYFSICICVLRVFFLYSAILICTEWTFRAGSCVGLFKRFQA